MVSLNTTWQEMSDDKQVYKEAFELVYKDKLVQELINKKILKRWIVGTNNRINRRDDYIFDLNTEFVIRSIIIKLYDKKHTYFVHNAKKITEMVKNDYNIIDTCGYNILHLNEFIHQLSPNENEEISFRQFLILVLSKIEDIYISLL